MMENFLGRLLVWLRGQTVKLLLLAGVLLLVWGILSPVGTLVWWLSESAETLGLKKNATKSLPGSTNSTNIKTANINCYIVFLPGVGDFSADRLTPGEEYFLNNLVKNHPNCVVVDDVFPYSVANESLGGERLLAPLWRAAENGDGWLENADILIKIRNLWRFAISADDRYGVVYNQGIAAAIIDRMNAAHPIPQSQQKVKIILIGTSGGAQVALGAADYLKEWLRCLRRCAERPSQLIVVSVGGSFDGEDGFDEVDRVYHLVGSQDWVEKVTSIFFPSRWGVTVGSPFNQARQQGRYSVVESGPHAHDGSRGYFGTKSVKNSATTYVDLTLEKVQQLPIWSEQK